MATITRHAPGCSNAIRGQHERLKSLLEAIEIRLSHETRPSRNLVSLLNALADHLEMLFELEETDGYFTELAQQSPGLSVIIERLLRDHVALRSEVAELVNRGREALNDNQETGELAQRLENFRARLNAHEHDEIKIIQELYNRDLGTKD